MERPLKQARLFHPPPPSSSTNNQNDNQQQELLRPTSVTSAPPSCQLPFNESTKTIIVGSCGGGGGGGGFTEEEFCDLLREESNESKKGPFLHWLSGYVGSPAVYGLGLATMRLLHGWLVLQLVGSAINDNKKKNNHNNNSHETTRRSSSNNHKNVDTFTTNRLILSTLRQIYLTHRVTVLLNPSELGETMKVHLRQCIDLVRALGWDEGCSGDNEEEQEEKEEGQATLDLCLQSIDLLIHAHEEQYGEMIPPEGCPADEEYKDFLLALLSILRREEKKQQQQHSIFVTATQLLYKLSHAATSDRAISSQEEHSIHFWARMAQSVVEEYGNYTSNHKPPPGKVPSSQQCFVWYQQPQHHSSIARYNNHNHTTTTPMEWLFRIECRVQFGVSSVVAVLLDGEQEELVRLALGRERVLALRAARCLARLVLVPDPVPTPTLLHRWIQVFAVAHPCVKIQLLPALRRRERVAVNGRLRRRRRVQQEWTVLRYYISNGDETTVKTIVSTLVDLILTAPEYEHPSMFFDPGMMHYWRDDAARSLRDVFSLLGGHYHPGEDSSSPTTFISHQDIWSICLAFLESGRPEAMACAVDTLLEFVLQNGGAASVPLVAHVSSDVLWQSLVTPLLSWSCDMRTKEKTMDLLVLLTRQRPRHLSQLVRVPRALEGLVRSASSSSQQQQQQNHNHNQQQRDDHGGGMSPPSSFLSSRLKHQAMSILLGMADDPVNHRIMAKQTGLLSVLIRYIREEEEEESYYGELNQEPHQSATDSEDGDSPMEISLGPLPLDREAIKASILRIAAAL